MRKVFRFIFVFMAMVGITGAGGAEAVIKKDYPVKPVLFTQVHFQDTFWAPKIEINRKASIPSALKQCETTGRIDNFAVAGGLKKGEFRGDYPFDDTDVYKVLEGASYALAVKYDREPDQKLDEIIKLIAAAQEDDGYLYTCRTSGCTRPNILRWMGAERWERLNSHELYNCGHLYEAAAAHYQATGKRTLLEVALKNADLIARVFGPGQNQKHVPSGHPIVEMALVKLYRITGQQRYLALAKYFIDEAGRGTDGHPLSPYSQDHMPVIRQEEALGHAVRFGYLYSGVADAAALTGQVEYARALEKVWENGVRTKLYITGGLGARSMGEGFGNNYELPNMTAYCETCASIASIYWNYRLFLSSGQSRFYDVLERTLYNGFLSGVSLDGTRFFYDNPLESNGENERQEWFGCACCPGNVTRFMASVPGYQYAVDDEGIYVNLFAAGEAEITVKGKKVAVRMETGYPWDGHIKLKPASSPSVAFNWYIRIPGWARGRVVPSDLYSFLLPQRTQRAQRSQGNSHSPAGHAHQTGLLEGVILRVNGKKIDYKERNGYAVIPGEWKAGDSIELELPMPVRRIETHPLVVNNRGKIALQRGPLVYCLEAPDNGKGYLFDTMIPAGAEITAQFEKELLNGVVTLTFTGKKLEKENGRIVEKETVLKAIPYHTWNNRGPGNMVVWIPREKDAAIIKPEPAIASKSKPAASTGWAYGLNDGFEPRDSGDTDKPFFYWWLKKGTGEWVEYIFDQPYEVGKVQVYWLKFDHYDYVCRPPATWEVLYRDGDRWEPVRTAAPETAYTRDLDRYNTVEFSPVRTGGLRIRVRMQEGVSAGIMEWKVF